jgi:hypothetical protein
MNADDRRAAIEALRGLLECPGCVVPWEEVEAALRKLPGRVLLNLQYRIESLVAGTKEEAERWYEKHGRW